jgi:hypothetical protein
MRCLLSSSCIPAAAVPLSRWRVAARTGGMRSTESEALCALSCGERVYCLTCAWSAFRSAGPSAAPTCRRRREWHREGEDGWTCAGEAEQRDDANGRQRPSSALARVPVRVPCPPSVLCPCSRPLAAGHRLAGQDSGAALQNFHTRVGWTTAGAVDADHGDTLVCAGL